MTAWISDLVAFATASNPRFECRAAGRANAGAGTWVARLRHELHPRATLDEVDTLKNGFTNPLPQEFIEFYSRHNGARLYIDTVENSWGFHTSGIFVAPIDEWPSLGEHVQEWRDSLDEAGQMAPAWMQDAIVFGEVPQSGNYFVLAISGEMRGRIVYFNHDGFEFQTYANNLAEFFAKVTDKPAQVLYDLGCYARYFDGKTSQQWIPEAYRTG
jgi:hypothetical protein